MALNTNEGLEVGGQVVDPSTDAGFAAVLESRGVPADPAGSSTPSRDVREGLSTAEPGTPGRGSDGKFVSTQEANAVGQPAQQGADTSTVVFTSDDPDVAALLSRYDGDPEKALKALGSAQSLIGRQGQELGDLRTQVAELRGFVTAQAAAAAPVAPQLTPDQIESTVQSLTASLGYHAAAVAAVNQYGESVYDAVIGDWALADPIQAQRFDLDYQLWKRDQNATANAPAATPAGWGTQAEQDAKVNALTTDFAVIEANYGGKDAFAPVLAQMEAAMEQMPPNVLAMVDSLDAEARQQGLSLVADRAARLAAAAGVAPVPPGTPTPEQQAAVITRKLGGQVASSTARPVAAPAATPQNREEAIAQFKRDLVATETTSVREGLTYGAPLPGYSPR